MQACILLGERDVKRGYVERLSPQRIRLVSLSMEVRRHEQSSSHDQDYYSREKEFAG
jgi:hypothetical protein